MNSPADGLTILPGERLDCTDREYFSDHSRISNTMIGDLIEHPRIYHAYYVTGTRERKPATEAMRLGSMVHAALLETIDDRFAVLPEGTERRSNKGKAAYAAFIAEHAGALVVKYETYAKAQAMREALLANPKSRRLIELDGESELAIGWEDPATGLPCKAKIDRLITSAELAWDLKSTKNPSPDAFASAVKDFGYHRAHAHYTAGCRSLDWSGSMPFVCVRNEFPFEVAINELDVDAIALGEQQVRRALDDLARRLETDDWAAPWENQMNEVHLPAWALRDLEVLP